MRALDGVASTETFLYLEMVKQLYDWGTRATRRQHRAGARSTRPAAGGARSPLAPLHADGRLRDAEVPIIVRGDGCYLEDSNGKRYLDALAGLFSRARSATRYGEEMGEAARRADARAALLHELVVRAPARDRARARGRVARARAT